MCAGKAEYERERRNKKAQEKINEFLAQGKDEEAKEFIRKRAKMLERSEEKSETMQKMHERREARGGRTMTAEEKIQQNSPFKEGGLEPRNEYDLAKSEGKEPAYVAPVNNSLSITEEHKKIIEDRREKAHIKATELSSIFLKLSDEIYKGNPKVKILDIKNIGNLYLDFDKRVSELDMILHGSPKVSTGPRPSSAIQINVNNQQPQTPPPEENFPQPETIELVA